MLGEWSLHCIGKFKKVTSRRDFKRYEWWERGSHAKIWGRIFKAAWLACAKALRHQFAREQKETTVGWSRARQGSGERVAGGSRKRACFVLFCFWLMSFNPHNYLLYLRRGRTWDSGRFSACPRVTQLIRAEPPSHWWVYHHQSEGTGKAGRTHLRGTPRTSRPCLKLTSNSQSCQAQGKQHAL